MRFITVRVPARNQQGAELDHLKHQRSCKMRAWKLFAQRRDGTVGPLFINRRLRVPEDVWLPAETHPTTGFSVRPYWHACAEPVAPHLSERGRVWREVEISGVQKVQRPKNQGGVWYLADNLKLLSSK